MGVGRTASPRVLAAGLRGGAGPRIHYPRARGTAGSHAGGPWLLPEGWLCPRRDTLRPRCLAGLAGAGKGGFFFQSPRGSSGPNLRFGVRPVPGTQGYAAGSTKWQKALCPQLGALSVRPTLPGLQGPAVPGRPALGQGRFLRRTLRFLRCTPSFSGARSGF